MTNKLDSEGNKILLLWNQSDFPLLLAGKIFFVEKPVRYAPDFFHSREANNHFRIKTNSLALPPI